MDPISFDLLELPGTISTSSALSRLTTGKAEFAIVKGVRSPAIIDVAQLRARAAVEPDALLEQVETPHAKPGVVLLEFKHHELEPSDWVRVAEVVAAANATGVVINYGTSKAKIIRETTVAMMAGSAKAARVIVGAGGPRAYKCEQCTPPTFEIPASGDAPLCRFFPIEHGEMVPA